MKYYIYISDTKIDMLYPQIPQSLLKKIAASLNIDLKLLGAEVNIGAKSNSSDETRYAKVKIVSEYVEKHRDVGSVDAPSTYFKGNLPMQQGQLGSATVYFGGVTNGTILGLSGSLRHVIGSQVEAKIHLSASSIPGLTYVLNAEIKGLAPGLIGKKGGNDILSLTAELTKDMLEGPKQQLEFLAKTLLQGPFLVKNEDRPIQSPQSYVVLGTPIYVAIAD